MTQGPGSRGYASGSSRRHTENTEERISLVSGVSRSDMSVSEHIHIATHTASYIYSLILFTSLKLPKVHAYMQIK